MKIIGKDHSNIDCERLGIKWNLDLEEGIDFYLYLFGRYEKSSFTVMKDVIRKGDIALDIGANIGAHTLPMLELVGKSGRVIAIEPTNWAFEKMTRNIELNPHLKSRAISVQSLLNEESNKKDVPSALYSSWSFDDSKEKHEILRGTLQSTSNASIDTLDDLVENLNLDKVDFIKMDVDGYECKVFRGAHRTIAKFRPTMLLEFSPFLLLERGGTLEEYIQFLIKYDYQLFEESSRKELTMNIKDLNEYIPTNGAINAIAKPRV